MNSIILSEETFENIPETYLININNRVLQNANILVEATINLTDGSILEFIWDPFVPIIPT
jgi:hypothetical protein